MRLLHDAAQCQAARGGEQGHKHGHGRKQQRMMYVQADAGAKQHPRGRDDHQTGGQSLKRACNDLFNGEPGNIHRRQQSSISRVN